MKKDFQQSLSTEQLDLLDCEGAVRCYVCNKGLKKDDAAYVGGGEYRCRMHNEATIARLQKRR